ncbi:copper homeostasis protein CutC [Bacillus sp. EB106-08-02-XG196]|jgi:copper homeostasis protein|uniref:copper homeostasis protein CutC n=1 Tax=Bacillus sp. EB106-08-02-XG196 TaxID=2737049 RepID=UPI0015C445FE|nr:copper homeostasis protein CutC [Bacillus sp. EB106-08-02-XG196]NWQ40552.1 copper homeostasis protein CutC [Bacillus sp. EB106-08-02-XG196]
MLKEVCVENFTFVPEAIELGANRVELCDHLAVGGTTVSHGVAALTIQYCHRKNCRVMAIVRPRGGNFIYNKAEIEIMQQDITHLKQMGVDGVVIGCLKEDGWIDEETMLMLLDNAKGVDVTFHMAFDQINLELQFQAIDWLASRGVQRILTHGGPSHTLIENNLDRLRDYINFAGNRIIILPGGGITVQNLPLIVNTLNISEIHGTKILGELGSEKRGDHGDGSR